MACALIGLGSNLGNLSGSSTLLMARAVHAIAQLGDVDVSSLYRSAPLGPQDQPDFYNAVMSVSTCLEPLALLDYLQHLEQQAGRVRLRHWGERTLDLDLLDYAGLVMAHPRLTLPHGGLGKRVFVDWPLRELQGDQAAVAQATTDELRWVAGPTWWRTHEPLAPVATSVQSLNC